jgi:hypothetical protein
MKNLAAAQARLGAAACPTVVDTIAAAARAAVLATVAEIDQRILAEPDMNALGPLWLERAEAIVWLRQFGIRCDYRKAEIVREAEVAAAHAETLRRQAEWRAMVAAERDRERAAKVAAREAAREALEAAHRADAQAAEAEKAEKNKDIAERSRFSIAERNVSSAALPWLRLQQSKERD